MENNIVKTSVLLQEVSKINSFISAAGKVPYDIDLVRGRYIIDAKSVMGIYSLSLDKPIDLIIHGSIDTPEVKTFIDSLRSDKILYTDTVVITG